MFRLMLALLGFTLFKIPVHRDKNKNGSGGNSGTKKGRRYTTPKDSKDGKDGKEVSGGMR